LPDTFLRRCLFHYVKFPQREDLIKIVKARFPFPDPRLKVLDAIIHRFINISNQMQQDKPDAGKKVSTLQLMDCIDMLLKHNWKDEILRKLKTELLYPGVLLYSWDDYRRYAVWRWRTCI
jgi:MoxR-like ATPase